MHDLWADADHEQTLVAARTETRARSSHAAGLLTAVRRWLLEEYLPAYCRALAATPLYRRCYWIDALGGDAGQEGGEQEKERSPASPLSEAEARRGRRVNRGRGPTLPAALQPIALLNEQLRRESRPITLYGLLLQAAPARRTRGERSATTPAIPREGGVLPVGWPDIAASLLEELEQAPAVFALNPLSPALLRYEDLELLAQRSAPTELCLAILHRQLASRLRAAQRLPAQAEALVRLLRNDRWKAYVPKGEQAETGLEPTAIEGLLDLLSAPLQRRFLMVQRIAVPLQAGPAVVAAAPCTLIFATRRQDSLLAMNDAVCLWWRRLEDQSRRGWLGAAWFQAQQEERRAAAREQLYQRVLQLGRATRSRRWPELRQQLIVGNFGQFTLAEYDETIRRLLRAGEVRCEWRQRAPAGGSAGATAAAGEATSPEELAPGSEDLLLWTGRHQ
jgi:hypothetical protein